MGRAAMKNPRSHSPRQPDETHLEFLTRSPGPVAAQVTSLLHQVGPQGALKTLGGLDDPQLAATALGELFIQTARKILKELPERATLADLEQAPLSGPILVEVARRIGKDGARDVLRSGFLLGRFERSGRWVYEPGPGLSTALGGRALPPLRCDGLVLPHPAIYLHLTAAAGVTLTSGAAAYGSFIAETATADGLRSWLVWTVADGVPGEFLELQLPGPGTVEEQLLASAASRAARSQLTFAIQLVLYASSPDVEQEDVMLNPVARALWEQMKGLPSGKRRDAARDQLRQLDARRRIQLGRGVKG